MPESFLFTTIDLEKGYAVPSKHFWDLWNSEKQEAVRRLGFHPRPYGELVGSTAKWIVALPRNPLKVRKELAIQRFHSTQTKARFYQRLPNRPS